MNQETPGPYRLFRLSGQPIFAVPASPRRARLAGIARYQPISRKRALYRTVMHLLMTAGLDRFVSTTVANPVEHPGHFDFNPWLLRLRVDMDEPRATGVVFWPPQRDRGRIYVHVFSGTHQPIAFARVSFDRENDVRLNREAQLLRELTETTPRTFRIPRVHAVSPTGPDGHLALIVEAIPQSARPLAPGDSGYPSAAVAEFAGEHRTMSAENVRESSWWAEYQARLEPDHTPFADELESLLPRGASVCRVHGDFGHANILQDGSTLWIFDWEESDPAGPAMTDEIGFFLSVNRSQTQADHNQTLARFRDRFLDPASADHRVDVMLALAFRLTVNTHSAGPIISHWNQT